MSYIDDTGAHVAGKDRDIVAEMLVQAGCDFIVVSRRP